MFAKMYTTVMHWARHKYADRILAAISFFESIIWPIPTDVMLIPMALAQPNRAMYLASLTTFFSVLGGCVGYLIGMWAFPTVVEPLLQQFGYMPQYEMVHEWFMTWGFWIIFIASFSPIPYKVFTVTAGLVGIAFLPFLIASIIGRGGRFYLVSFLMAWGGPRLEQAIHRFLLRFGWLTVGLFLAVVVGYYIFRS